MFKTTWSMINRVLFLLLIVAMWHSVAVAQNKLFKTGQLIKVPLTEIHLTLPFSVVSNSATINSDQNKFHGIPNSLERYVIRSTPTLPEQALYERYQKGDMSAIEWLNRQKRIDTTRLSKQPLKHHISALVGITKSKKKLVIVDQNNNQDFSDDSVLTYSSLEGIARKDGRYLVPLTSFEDSLPVIQIQTQIIDQGKIKSVSWRVKPSPYNRVEIYKDSTLADIHLEFQTATHLEGQIVLAGKRYQFAVSNNDVTPVYQANQIAVKVAESSENFSTQDDINPAYQIGQSFYLGNRSFKLHAISYQGDTLYIAPEGLTKRVTGPRPNQYAPSFQVNDLQGSVISLASLRGQYVVLDFWGSWCGPCLDLLPDLQSFAKKYQAQKNVRLISIAREYTPQPTALKGLIRKHHLTWPQVAETPLTKSKNRMIDRYQVTTFPTTILLSPTGQILHRGSGKLSFEQLKQLLSKQIETSKN